LKDFHSAPFGLKLIPEKMFRRFSRWLMNLGLPMDFLMARRACGDEILGGVIAQSAPQPNVVDLKILHSPHDWHRQPSRSRISWQS